MALDSAQVTPVPPRTAPLALGPARLPAPDRRRCTGCGRCVAVCELHLLSLEVERWEKSAVLRGAERCTGCSACAVACPFHAIVMRRPAPAR